MNPDSTKPTNQAGDVPPQQPEPVQPAKSASNPFGPRPVAPVYSPSQQSEPALPAEAFESLVPEQEPSVQQVFIAEPTEQPTIAPPPPIQDYSDPSTVPQSVSPVTLSPALELPAPNVEPSVQPSPTAQTEVVPQPVQPQVAASLPSFAAPPQGNQNAILSDPNQEPKSKKVIMLIIAAIGALLAVGIMAFLIMNLNRGTKLQEYSNDDFSISYPTGMSVKEDDSGIEINEDGKKNGSLIQVMRPLQIGNSASEVVKTLSEGFKNQADEDEDLTIVSSKEKKINGVTVTAIYVNKKEGLKLSEGVVMLVPSKTNDLAYVVSFESVEDGIDVVSSADDVVKTFTIKAKR